MAQQKFSLTKEGLEEQLKKRADLLEAQRLNIIALQDARGQGDLSENADYTEAKKQESKLAAEIQKVENILNNYVLIDENDASNLGKFITVRFLDEEGSEDETYKLVGTVEADPLNQKISDESPLGKVIVHAKKGDKVLVNTEDGEKFEVIIVDIVDELKPKGKKKK